MVGEPIGDAAAYGPDRQFVFITTADDPDPGWGRLAAELQELGHPGLHLELADPLHVGAEFVRWEVATAAAGMILEIDPFDQPNVQEAKDATRALLEAYRRDGALPQPAPLVAEPGIAAYADAAALGDTPVTVDGALSSSSPSRSPATTSRSSPTSRRIQPPSSCCSPCAASFGTGPGWPTTLGFGPRFLHSTGQLHKGGPDAGLFLQLTAEPRRDLPIPGWQESFGTLIAAQAAGDLAALQGRGRRVLRLHLADPAAGLPRLEAMMHATPSACAHVARKGRISTPMDVAICGLGRMGAGMARRLARGDHGVVAWNRTEQVAVDLAAEPENEGRIKVAEPLARLAEMMEGPRHVLISVPSGDATADMVERLAGILSAGRRDRRRRQQQLPRLAAARRRAGGARPRVPGHGRQRRHLGPAGRLLRHGRRQARGLRPLRAGGPLARPRDGYLYCGPAGAGHYVKMVHNGIEYGLMQAYGEGFDILHASEFDLDLAAVARLWNNGSVIRSWLLELAGDAFEQEGNDLEPISAAGWPTRARAAGPSRRRSSTTSRPRSSPSPCCSASAAGAIPTASATGCWPPCATSSAATPSIRQRRPRRPASTARPRPRSRDPERVATTTAPNRSSTKPDLQRGGERVAPSPNPLREGLRHERIPEPCTMVIIGATGDLTERKLGPALYNLMLGGALPPEFTVVGFARRDLTNEQFSAHLLEGVNKYSRNKPAKASIWESFARGIEYHRGDLDDPAAYAELAKRLDRIDRDRGTAGQPALLPGRAAQPLPRYRSAAPRCRPGGQRRRAVE